MAREAEIKPSRMHTHTIQIDNRERVSLTGVTDVESFNEREVSVVAEAGSLLISGEGLHISRLNLDEGQLIVEGLISAIEYGNAESERKGGLFKFFR